MKRTSTGLEISDMELNMIGYFQVDMKTVNGDWYRMDGSSACGPHQAVEIMINDVSFVAKKRD